MNSLADLIEFLQPEPYSFVGSYWLGERASHPLSFDCDCEFTHDAVSVLGEGAYRVSGPEQKSPFQVRLRFASPVIHAASVEVTTPRLGELKGKLFFLDGGGSFVARNESAALSAQLGFSERGVISLTGVLELQQRHFGYSLKGVATSNRASLSNVVGLRRA